MKIDHEIFHHHSLPSAGSRRAVVSFWAKNVQYDYRIFLPPMVRAGYGRVRVNFRVRVSVRV